MTTAPQFEIAAALPSRGSKSTARIVRVLALAAVVGASLALAGCGPQHGDAAAAEAPAQLPQVAVVSPITRSVDVYDEVVGRFEAVQSVEISAQVSGRLAEVHFQDGQLVKAGDPLFTIDSAPFAAAVDQAEAELVTAQAMGALAQDEMERAERLVGHDAISQEEYDRRASGAQEAAAAVRAAQARLNAVRIDHGYTTITAPISGRVSDRRIDPGNLVRANETLLTTLVSMDPIYVSFAITPEVASMIGRPEPGSDAGPEVQFRLEGESDFSHSGRLDFIDNQVDPQTGVVRARAVVDNPAGRFSPGQFVRVRFARARIANAVLVPDTAVSSDQNYKYVLVVNAEDVVEPRPIAAGPIVEGLRVVENGLAPDDRVIVGGGQTAYPGTHVSTTQGEIELASR